MDKVNATILIPDISGFTEFITNTELTHGSLAVNMLIDSIIKAVDEAYEISEIEGDAVLMIRKDPAPSRREIYDICLKIFHAFHYQRKWMQQHMICPCKACLNIENLTLKFVVHHGPLAEITVGRFVKHTGTEMIVAHRLLKNSIQNNEYLLVTEKLLQKTQESSEFNEKGWNRLSDEFASIGKIDYHYMLLEEARKNVPDPPDLENDYQADNTAYHEVAINAGYRDVYMAMMNIPSRNEWCPGLLNVAQEIPAVYIGSMHCCTFENFQATVSPLRMILTEENIIYAETCRIDGTNYRFVHEFLFKHTGDNSCSFAGRFMNMGELPVPDEIRDSLQDCLHKMASGLKFYCENIGQA